MRSESGIRYMLGLLLTLAVVAGSGSVALAQTPEASPAGVDSSPALGDAVLLFDSSGDEVAQVAVSQVADPYQGAEEADRGFHWVGVELVVENLGDSDFALDMYGVHLIDETGYVSTPGFAFREEDVMEAEPELVGESVSAGETVSGWLFYQVVDDAVPTRIVYYAFTDDSQFSILANLDGAIADIGAATPLFSSDGSEIGSVTVDEIITGFEETDAEIRTTRGSSIVAVDLTIANDGDSDLDPASYSLYLVDEIGFLYSPTFISRSDASTADHPDLASDLIPAGGSTSGTVFYEIPNEATASYLIYTPTFENLFVLAQPGAGSVVSGDALAPVGSTGVTPDGPDEIPAETDECVGVSAWVDDLNDRITTMFESFGFLEGDIADADPDDVRDAADAMDDVIRAQSEAEVPPIAQDANDAMVALLETYQDVFNEIADRLEAGEDPETIENDLGGPEGDVLTSIDVTAAAFETLQETCPGSNVEQIGF